MYTVCPKCGLMLVVTAADLRAAQGHVRCGRCRSVFNALESLSESPPQESPSTPSAPPPHSVAAPEPPAMPSKPVPAMAEHAAPEPMAQEPQTADDVWFELEAAAQEPPPQVEEPAAIAAQEPAAVQQAEEPSPGPAAAALQSAPQPARHDAPLPAEEPAPGPAAFELETADEPRTGRWLLGAFVLLLVLAGQLVNHYRGTLATVPSVGRTVRAFYGALGIPVVPLWNVRAYEARQLGATVSGHDPHQITVRASIANRGHWPLPLPLLRVTLQDRYGRTIAARDVPPRDYLANAASASAMLPAGGRIDATVAFVNPGPQAIGFEIDACLREGAAVVCAHGPR